MLGYFHIEDTFFYRKYKFCKLLLKTSLQEKFSAAKCFAANLDCCKPLCSKRSMLQSALHQTLTAANFFAANLDCCKLLCSKGSQMQRASRCLEAKAHCCKPFSNNELLRFCGGVGGFAPHVTKLWGFWIRKTNFSFTKMHFAEGKIRFHRLKC